MNLQKDNSIIDTGFFLFDKDSGKLSIKDDPEIQELVRDILESDHKESHKLSEVFEHWFVNSEWDLHDGNDIMMYSGDILSEGYYTDDGEYIIIGDYFYSRSYVFTLMSEKLLEDGYVIFEKHKIEKFNGLLTITDQDDSFTCSFKIINGVANILFQVKECFCLLKKETTFDELYEQSKKLEKFGYKFIWNQDVRN